LPNRKCISTSSCFCCGKPNRNTNGPFESEGEEKANKTEGHLKHFNKTGAHFNKTGVHFTIPVGAPLTLFGLLILFQFCVLFKPKPAFFNAAQNQKEIFYNCQPKITK
jgi:hypothetical protein